MANDRVEILPVFSESQFSLGGRVQNQGTKTLEKAEVAVRGPPKEERGAESGPGHPEDTVGPSVVSSRLGMRSLGRSPEGPGQEVRVPETL